MKENLYILRIKNTEHAIYGVRFLEDRGSHWLLEGRIPMQGGPYKGWTPKSPYKTLIPRESVECFAADLPSHKQYLKAT